MTIPAPFSQTFPLAGNPFKSRIESQMDAAKNYWLVAFRPGFPLQAAELNELQEIFYIQQTLNQELIKNWLIADKISPGYVVTGIPWEGCTPVNPNLITLSPDSTNITFKSGWYLLKQTSWNSGFGVWIYNSTDSVVTLNNNGDYGILVKLNTITCTTNASLGQNQDSSLQDSSNINVINGPCGASRIQIELVSFGSATSSTLETVFLPIINKTSDNIFYKNDLIIPTG